MTCKKYISSGKWLIDNMFAGLIRKTMTNSLDFPMTHNIVTKLFVLHLTEVFVDDVSIVWCKWKVIFQ